MTSRAYQQTQYNLDNDSALTKETISMLNALLSRQGIAILKALYDSPRMQQKNLAATIHTSPASLSNIISKLEAIQPGLLKSERIGRAKFYFLTDIATAYVENELLQKEKTASSKIHPFDTSSFDDTLTNETLHFYDLFQKAAGNEWFLVLDNLLAGIQDLNKVNDELYNRYMDFMESLIQLRIRQKSIAIRKIYDVVNNNILIKRLENYLNDELKDLYILEPLFDIEKEDYEKAYLIIDYIFCELRPNIFGAAGSLEIEDFFTSIDQYYKIHHQISQMINQFRDFNGNITNAVAYWSEKLHVKYASLQYMASKCYTVFITEQRA